MGGVLLLAAWIMYPFDEAAAFRRAQEAHDTEQAAMLPKSMEQISHGEPCEHAYNPDVAS